MIYLLLILVAVAALYVLTHYSKKGRIMNKLPGYTPYPLVGNLPKFNMTCPHEIWNQMRKTTEEFYPITRIWFVRSAVISIRHPDDAEVLLTSQKVIDKGYPYDYLHPWLKTGLLTSTGEKWRHRRKILTPAFHFNILKKYLNIINEEGERCVLGLKSEENETIKNLGSFCSKFTLNVICEAAMGVTLDKMDSNKIDIYKKAIYDFGYVVLYRIPRPFVFDWVMKLPWKIADMQKNALTVLHEFTDKVVRERKLFHESTENIYLKELDDLDEDNIDIGRKKRLAMLDLLLAAEKKGLIDEDGIKEEVDTFTFEGHDTTGTALTFTLMLLAENKEAQDRAREEVTEILDRNGGKLGMIDVQELHYLERCIKESLRLYPPVSTVFRYTAEDLQLKYGLVPGGTHLVFHIYDTHRDSNFWPNPDKFDPDRFLPENSQKRHQFAYLPFSAGPRNCIGQKFAMLELKASVARILHNFYLEPIDRSADVKLIADIVIRPLNPISMKFVRINKE